MKKELRLFRDLDAGVFLERVLGFLLRREAANCLILGTLGTLKVKRPLPAADPYFAALTSADGIEGVAFQWAPRPLILTNIGDEGLDLLVEDLLDSQRTLAGVVAQSEPAFGFARRWAERNGCTFREIRRQRVHQLERIEAGLRLPHGSLRMARTGDLALARNWIAAFSAEIAEDMGDCGPTLIEEGALCFWEAPGKGSVCMAGCTGKTPNGIRVILVYTPPEHRGHGYATACTAALTGKLLAEGNRYCFLFTDLANPASNRVYEKIGYRAVEDSVFLGFNHSR